MPTKPKSRLDRILHPFLRKGRAHWLRFAVLLLLGMAMGHELEDAEWLTDLKWSMYQKQMRLLHAGDLYPRRTSLVLLDDDDYYSDAFQRRSPINRSGLAAIIDRLGRIGVSTIVVDFDLRVPRPLDPHYEMPAYRAEDQALLDAMGRACTENRHLVMTSALRWTGERYRVIPSVFSDALPSLPCVSTGYLQFPYDLRTVPGPVETEGDGHQDSLALAAVKLDDPIAYADATRNIDDTFRFGQFLSEKDYEPRNGRQFIFSAADLERMAPATLRAQLANRIVLISGHWHDRAYGVGNYTDMHNSPGGEMPGAMVHANYIESLLDRTGTFNRIPDTLAKVLETLMVIGLALIGALEIHAGLKWAAFVAGLTLSILLTYVLLQNLGLFLDFLIPLLMIVIHTAVEEILETRTEVHHLKRHLKEQSHVHATHSR